MLNAQRLIIISISLSLFTACAIGRPPPRPIATYDFGLYQPNTPAAAKIDAVIMLNEVTTTRWIDTSAILYRLAYNGDGRIQAYSDSRWLAPPATLLTAQLRQALAQASTLGTVNPTDGAVAPYQLHIQLEEFSQVFDSTSSSRGIIRARATLVGGAQRALLAQRTFDIQNKTISQDAKGAVSSLSQGVDQLVNGVVAWLVTVPELNSSTKR